MADVGFPDDFDPTPELRKAMTKILQAVETWQKAVKGSDNEAMWFSRLDEVRKKAKNVYDLMTDELVFPGKSQQAAYNDAVKAYLDLNDDIQFSKDTLPRPDLVDQAESFIKSLKDFPEEAIHGIGDAATKAVDAIGEELRKLAASLAAGASGSAWEVLKKLWPWALGAVAVVVAVEFGPQIVKAVKK